MMVKVTQIDAIAIVTALRLYETQIQSEENYEADPHGAVADTEHVVKLIERFEWVKEHDDSPNEIGGLG